MSKKLIGFRISSNNRLPIPIDRMLPGGTLVIGDEVAITDPDETYKFVGRISRMTQMYKEYFVFEVSLSFWPTDDETLFVAIPIEYAVDPRHMNIYLAICDHLPSGLIESNGLTFLVGAEYWPQFRNDLDVYFA